jgi:chromate reductase, NAD(P)H dehydrogenase (quinone)
MRILLISGSTRAASTNTAALRTMHETAPYGVETSWYDGLTALPAFNPDDADSPPPTVTALTDAIAAADAVLFCTPEYAGSLPGSFKNLLDWTVKGGELYNKPVAFVSVAAEGRGSGAEATLRTVLGYVGADLLGDACVRIYVARESVGADGRIADQATRDRLVAALLGVAAAASAASSSSAAGSPGS